MGAACTKSSAHAVEGGSGVASSERIGAASRPTKPAVGDENSKARHFRERRLSVAQMSAEDLAAANGKVRRDSVYGSSNGSDPSGIDSPVPSCGCKTLAGLEPVPGGFVSKINQDRALALYPFNGDKACSLFGVFDGHGRNGAHVSEYVIRTLPKVLEADEHLMSDPSAALRRSFVQVDQSLGETLDASVSGTTAVASLIRGNQIWLANCGDSRAVLARQRHKSGSQLKAIDLTRDHKPDTPDEKRRILRMGGHVSPAGAHGAPSRVWHNLRGLAMARSIGDHHAAAVGVIASPEVTEYRITDDDVALVLASDGVWELLSSQAVVDMVASVKTLDPNEICAKIVAESARMWRAEEGDYRDDITVVVLTFPWLESYGDEGGEEVAADAAELSEEV